MSLIGRGEKARTPTPSALERKLPVLLRTDFVLTLVDVSDIFYFFCSGEGKAESGASGRGGGRFLMKIPGGGGGCRPGGMGGEAGGCLRGIFGGGGGLNIFFWGRNPHQVTEDPQSPYEVQFCGNNRQGGVLSQNGRGSLARTKPALSKTRSFRTIFLVRLKCGGGGLFPSSNWRSR